MPHGGRPDRDRRQGDIGPDAAFDLLRWRSQEGNVKLRALAEQVLADVLTLKHDQGAPPSRATFDELFLTAHQRVAAKGRN